MQTIAGGIVKYVDVQLLPCPEAPHHVGQVVAPARLDMLWHGRVVERIALRAGDELIVADGAHVAPDTEVIACAPYRRAIRAAIPNGVAATVRWSVAPIDVIDPITDLPALRLPAGRDVQLALVVDGAPIAAATLHDIQPFVRDGAVVRRGDRLAWTWASRDPRELWAGLATVRALLDARRLPRANPAVIAPCAATVIAIDRAWIDLRTDDDRALRIRLPRRARALVEVGERVSAGDPLTYGERNHRALLHAWGAHRLGDHLLDELAMVLGDAAVPRAYLALAVRAMLQRGSLHGIAELARDRVQ
jgi:hypothetical protein